MKSVLVAGGSSGIGEAVCRLAARRSWEVFIGYHRGQERAAAAAAEITKAGGQAWPVRLPMEEPAAVDEALDCVAKSAGRLDAVVLCASPAPVLGSFLKIDARSLEEQLRINVVGGQYLIAAAWRRFFSKQEGAGHIVAVLSQFSDAAPKPQMAAYVIGKRALLALLECALAELGPRGLRASAVSPGYTDTPMLRALNPHILEAARATQRDSAFLTAEQVAEKIMHCLDNAPRTPELFRCSLSNDLPR